MTTPEKVKTIINDLPDPEGAGRFFADLTERHPRDASRVAKDDALLSDILTLAAYSPLLATTMLQNSSYISWLALERADIRIRSKEDLLESLARFSLMHTQIEPHDQLARFRRRELLRIYLRDIRRLATVTEITEELSNLADAILEYALRLVVQEMDNRFGGPQETDEKGRLRTATFCIVALGKLGSQELNYSSDIDLLFLYSAEGKTSGSGTRGAVTNREYFIKLAEQIVKLVGKQSGEGAAYRIDVRLRPHGSIGAMAISRHDAVRYYQNEARPWERQVLIRSRSSAGDPVLFRAFETSVRTLVYSSGQSVEEALQNVRTSKQLIDVHAERDKGFNVKLGRGGIREIEFIAQALQLAYGGKDVWLRASHTLISLSRLADRGFIAQQELTQLFDAYDFLRRLEHILQMEHGLQTHTVPSANELRRLVAARMNIASLPEFDSLRTQHSDNVAGIFERVFANEPDNFPEPVHSSALGTTLDSAYLRSTDESAARSFSSPFPILSDRLSQIIKSVEDAENRTDEEDSLYVQRDYLQILTEKVRDFRDLGSALAKLRLAWMPLLAEIAVRDLRNDITVRESKNLQTELAEAAIDAALRIASWESRIEPVGLGLSVLGLGKLGSRGMDYESDLDVVLAYDEGSGSTREAIGKFVNTFITVLSGVTREGSLYRLDLRLRPYGKNGPPAIANGAIREYFEQTAAIWEMLAFVKLRGVSGNYARKLEQDIRNIIHERAVRIPPEDLRAETLRIRDRLEKEKTRRTSTEVNIKYGQGGMLDVFFAIRYLQLRDNLPDNDEDRSTLHTIERLHDCGSLDGQQFDELSQGYSFLSQLDHNLRLRVGRSSRLPLGNKRALELTAATMGFSGVNDLLEALTIHRLNIRNSYDRVMSV
jgi:glutamate-ammonia-ligase adenylyltransferase